MLLNDADEMKYTINGLSVGTLIYFPLSKNGKCMVLGVPIFKPIIIRLFLLKFWDT